ncbi:hypothetical protein GXP70_02605 [Paenibacillus lycopersici]|uniref:Flagellar protein n=1 Tax=Paenibacillus lycopersici TaxID=2704462 RepID=A0A6C0FVI3_9BACL|nr:hypothetical protein [Paenibacillus lycopersici]QHT58959.1 hypothetical protein GXP70_02605 [Paenibacillus lycopersici]
MSKELNIAHCPECGNVFQKNLRNLCASCTASEDREIEAIEKALWRDRYLANDQLGEKAAVSVQRIRALIRKGRLKLYEYPNLADACDLCAEPTRQGKLCASCLNRLKGEIEQDREKQKAKREHVFLSKNRR